MSKHKEYNEIFKLQMVQLVNAGLTQSEISTEYGVPITTLHGWIKKYNNSDEIKKAPQLSKSEIENIELKKRMKKLEMEVDILKQAALIIGRK
jgi:transposase